MISRDGQSSVREDAAQVNKTFVGVRRHVSLAESAKYKQMAVVHSSSSSMPKDAPKLGLTAQPDYPSSLIGVPVVMAMGRPLPSGKCVCRSMPR